MENTLKGCRRKIKILSEGFSMKIQKQERRCFNIEPRVLVIMRLVYRNIF